MRVAETRAVNRALRKSLRLGCALLCRTCTRLRTEWRLVFGPSCIHSERIFTVKNDTDRITVKTIPSRWFFSRATTVSELREK